MADDLKLIQRLNFGAVPEEELLDIYHQEKANYRILFNLVQHPKFPERFALEIIPKLYSIDLIKVIKNKRTRPFIRKRVELEFVGRYQKFPLGERLTYLKIAPNSLLKYFVEENNPKILKVILGNAYCTEELVIEMVNRKTSRHSLYEVLYTTEWFKRPSVAKAIISDVEAPIRIILQLIPLLTPTLLKKIMAREHTHQIVKNNIAAYLKEKGLE